MPTDHAAEVASLAAVVRVVFDDFAALGRVVPDDAMAALALVEQWVEGKPIEVADLQAAEDRSHQEGFSYAQREKDRALAWARGAAGNLAWTAKKARGWQQGRQSVMDAALYTLSSLGIATTKDHAQLEALRVQALAQAQARARALPKKKAAAASKKTKAISTDLSAFIGKAANNRLAGRCPIFDLAQRGSAAALRALLRKRHFMAHDAVMDFEQRFGGLVVADQGSQEGDDWIFGAYACLKSNAHADPHGAKPSWVPVAYSPNDCIYYLDDKGAAWAVDTIADTKASRFASDANAMMKRIFMM